MLFKFKARALAVLTLTITLVLFSNSSAHACIGASIQFNDDSFLSGDGFYSPISKESYTAAELTKLLEKTATKSMTISDSKKTKTHRITALGSYGDAEGTIFSSYLVKDLKTGTEKVYKLYTNYMGNGMVARAMEAPESQTKQDPNFQMLGTAGCGQ